MNAATQTFIVWIIGIGVIIYLIYKIINRVRHCDDGESPCCGCDTPCSLKEINSTREEKSEANCCKVEK